MAAAETSQVAARIGILGIAGRIGVLLAEESAKAGAIVSGGTRRSGEAGPYRIFPDAASLCANSDVVIDFTRAKLAA